MNAPHLIPPHNVGTPRTSRDSQGRLRSLPPDLIRDASTRLGILALLSAALWLLGTILGHLTLRFNSPPGDTEWRSLVLPVDAIAAGSIVISLAFYAYTRRATNPARSLDLGLVFMIVMAFALGVMFHVGVVFNWGRLPAGMTVRPELSWIGAVVLMFAAIVPTPPKKTMVAALIAVSMNPLGMLIARAHGAWDFGAASTVLVMHYPDYLLVGVAGVISHVVTQLGRQVTKAREMGSYRLGDLLGRGGMGEVYRATHTMLARPAAVKLIRPETLGASDSDAAQLAVKRFSREAEAAANLRSPHTVEVYDFGVTDDQTLYYVMEMLEGMDLESLVRQYGALPPGRAIYILRQACESLEEAHQAGLVHRDIKPANIHVGRVGVRYDFVKVLDFGLVKPVKKTSSDESLITAAGLALGTPAYMAPELALGEEVDGRADIYALGCVAYFLLTARPVFEADNTMRLMVKHVQEMPVPPSRRAQQHIPRSLDDAVLGSLAKDPASRPPTAMAFASALSAASADVEPWSEADAMAWWTRRATSAARGLAETPVEAVGTQVG
jgi:tRNA A-37 threonylcarbamoyl transferase component Bud32